MRRRGGRHRSRAVLALEADHLVGDHVQGFVPAYRLVSGHAAFVDVALALGIEVDPLERGEDSFGRVDGGLVSDGPRRKGGLSGRGELATPGLDRPRGPVAGVEFEGDDAQDLSILNVNVNRATGCEVRQPTYFRHLDVLLFCPIVCRKRQKHAKLRPLSINPASVFPGGYDLIPGHFG